MSNSKFSTGVSYGVLAGTAFFCASRYRSVNNCYQLPIISFQLMITHCCFGIFKYGFDNDGMEYPFQLSHLLLTIFSFPLIVSQLWINYDYAVEFASIHVGLPLVPLAMYLQDRPRPEMHDLLLTLNIASCLWITMENENWYGVACALIFAYTRGLFTTDTAALPKEDAENFCYSVMSLLALHALGYQKPSLQ